jgi:hypothetical protein
MNFYGRDAIHVLEQVQTRIAEEEHRAQVAVPIVPPDPED